MWFRNLSADVVDATVAVATVVVREVLGDTVAMQAASTVILAVIVLLSAPIRSHTHTHTQTHMPLALIRIYK